MIVHVIAKPNQRIDRLERDGLTIIAKIAAPAFEGRATAHLIQMLADYFGIAPSCIGVSKGVRSTHKTISIEAESSLINERVAALPQVAIQQGLF